jgi:hypothetical protein
LWYDLIDKKYLIAPKLTASSFDVYASTAETMRWGLRDVFFSGENLVYSISDSSATFSVT